MKTNFLLLISPVLFGSLICSAQTSWQIAGNSNITKNNFLGTTDSKPLIMQTNNKERMRIVPSGNMGIGTKTPDNTLHIFKGSAGSITGFINAPLVVENSTHNYINLLAPEISEEGVLFGNPASNASGEIIYNNSSTPLGFQFRVNNAQTKMVLDSAGSLGIGTLAFEAPFKLKLHQNAVPFGLDIEDQNSNDWEIWVGSEGLNLYFNNAPKGVFSTASGAYSSVSDERLKINIKPMASVLDQIGQLKPSTYQFKNTTDKQAHNGFIAQDVMKIFPHLVTHTVNPERNVDVYSLDYNGFGVIAIKAIQELKLTIENQQKQIDEQQTQINELKQMVKTLADKNSFSLNASSQPETTTIHN
jgi:hypothetical protein